jgi:hypothetical protein
MTSENITQQEEVEINEGLRHKVYQCPMGSKQLSWI